LESLKIANLTANCGCNTLGMQKVIFQQYSTVVIYISLIRLGGSNIHQHTDTN